MRRWENKEPMRRSEKGGDSKIILDRSTTQSTQFVSNGAIAARSWANDFEPSLQPKVESCCVIRRGR
eukprot:6254883-Ditylum_brightwellii.AAC.1